MPFHEYVIGKFYFPARARVLGWLNAGENVQLRITVRKAQSRKYMAARILFDVHIVGRRDKFILEIRADGYFRENASRRSSE